ncbi:MAG: glycosyl hydrolase family 18 protein [Candidatus Dojkabacteria bacterium]|nr:glycosyl hydrolase family 18 protein [Candidatus Dojkabacteria bacterium]
MVLSKEVIGFLPNWLNPDVYLDLNYDSITTIAWAFLGVQSDGSLVKQSYPPTNLINYAHSKGKKVVVSINPGWGSPIIDNILASASIQNVVINNLLYEVSTNGFDGVDIDLEGFPAINTVNGSNNRSLFTNFIIKLSNTFWNANPNYRLSINLPPVDWENVFDTSALSPYVNYFMLMGYDYHWASGPTAGAVAPLQSVVDSVNTYLQSIPKTKLLLGVPYYGYEWTTQTQQPDSPTIGTGTSFMYSQAVTKIQQYTRLWNSTWKSPYYTYKTGNQWHQGWYEDAESLNFKYDLVNQKQLAGIGIWALGYDVPHTELSNLIINKFSGESIQTYQCINNICTPSICIPGIVGCFTENTCGEICTPSQYHNICQNNICAQVSGPGTNECTTVGVQCPTITYNCINNQCVQVQGTSGQYSTLQECQTACITPPLTLCSPNDINFFGTCIKKETYMFATIGIFLVLIAIR